MQKFKMKRTKTPIFAQNCSSLKGSKRDVKNVKAK